MWRRLIACPVWLLAIGIASPLAGQAMAHRGWVGNGFAVDTWWKQAIFYEIDPLDFQDSNGDGFGDLPGLTSRLDYLETLGVDVIVLSPFRVQPAFSEAAGAAGGQMPGKTAWEAVYGSDEDFDKLEQEASRRHMRLVVDLTLDGSQTAQQVQATGRYWLGRGVAGLRLRHDASAVPLSADETTARTRMLRHLCAGYAGDRVLLEDRMLLEDAATAQSGVPQSFSVGAGGRKRTPHGDANASVAQLDFDEAPQQMTQWNAATVRGVLQGRVLHGGNNDRVHLVRSDSPDVVRSGTRSGIQSSGVSGAAQQQITLQRAKQLAVLLLGGAEWPLIYFGQEIGMISKAGEAGPAPMQWGGAPGFSSASPWIAMGPNAETANVTMEDVDPGSLLNWYRKLGALRHSQAALRTGSLTLLDASDPDVVAWVRRGTGQNAHATPVLVVMNLSDRRVVLSMRESLHHVGLEASSGIKPLAVSPTGATPSFTASSLALEAYGTYVGELRQAGLEASSVPVTHGRHKGR